MPQPSNPSPPHCRFGTRTTSRSVLYGQEGSGCQSLSAREAHDDGGSGDALEVVRVDVEPQRLVDVTLDDVVKVILVLEDAPGPANDPVSVRDES